MSRRTVPAVLAAVLAATLTATAAPAGAATGPPPPALAWGACLDDAPGVPVDTKTQCAFLRLPVDRARPGGATYELAVARRPALDRERRIGTLIFGPGGPGDSGVDRVREGERFGDELLDRFDIVSFDPRGVRRSAAPQCPAVPGPPRPAGLIADQADFDATVRFNRAQAAACRPTSVVHDHADTLSMVHDLDALRRALGEQRLSFHGSSYGTVLGLQYAERFPGRVRALVLEGVFDHSLGVRAFVRTQAAALQDSFDEFVAWCGDPAAGCALHGRDVRDVWARVLSRADQGEYLPSTAMDIANLPLGTLHKPDRAGLAAAIKALDEGVVPPPPRPLPLAGAVFCADWPAPVRDYAAYARLVEVAAAAGPDVRYGAGLLAVQTCLGQPVPVRNPPHEPRVRTRTPVLLLNARHDPRTGHAWAAHVAAQLGRHGRLVTYEGAGHGTYQRTACTEAVVDRYLVDLVVPPAGTWCPAE